MKKITGIILISTLVIITLTSASKDDKYFNFTKYLSIYSSALKEINMLYVDEVDTKELVETSINAMLNSLDPYTNYFSEENKEEVTLIIKGEYAGIGSIVGKKGNNVIIREPYKNSPADKAGLLPGDIIISIDGVKCSEDTEEASNMLKGNPNKEVELVIKRKFQDKNLVFKIIREKIQLPSIAYYGMLSNNIGYIRLNSFTDKSAQDTRNALIELKNKGATKLIYDLRGNSGGLLDQAVDISNLFIDKNLKVVYTRSKQQNLDNEYITESMPIAKDMPLIVLIDKYSASASEIVAGSLQDYDRAVLIGERSFGKGLVQVVRDLSYDTQIKITTSRYYIPSGRCIQELDYSNKDKKKSKSDTLKEKFRTSNGRLVYGGGGITPDIKIERNEYSTFLKEIVIQDLAFDFVNEYALKHPNKPEIKDFTISDNTLEEFKDYLHSNNFTYETLSQKLLDSFITTSKQERYYDLSKEEIEELKKILTHSIDRDMNLFKDEVKEILSEMFIQRYHYNEGLVKYSLNYDKSIEKSIEILSNNEEYKSILQGSSNN